MAGQILGVHSDLLDGVKSLETEKAQALQDISSSTKDMIVADLNKMSDAYLNFKNAQTQGIQTGKTLAEVLKEIGKTQGKVGA